MPYRRNRQRRVPPIRGSRRRSGRAARPGLDAEQHLAGHHQGHQVHGGVDPSGPGAPGSTGMEVGMRESCTEGVATHGGREPCVGAREGAGEASAAVRAGWAIEPRNGAGPGCRDDGPLQMSLFDTQNFAEISHPDYPGERLICCRNPFLAADRARKRQALLAATEKDLEKNRASVSARRLKGADKIGERVGKVIGRHKVGKHFRREITDTSFAYRRDEEKIAAEAASDGIYVIRTSVNEEILDSVGVITSCKNLKYAGRDFRITKADDLDLRPIYHYLDERVRGHVLICMLAAYLPWHLRQALAELTFTDQHIPEPADPVAPAQRSQQAKAKDGAKRNGDKLPVRKYGDLLDHLGTLDRQTVTFSGQKIEKITRPTPVQRRAFELLGAPVPLTLQ